MTIGIYFKKRLITSKFYTDIKQFKLVMYEFVTWSLEIANESCSDNLDDIKKRANDIFLKINII